MNDLLLNKRVYGILEKTESLEMEVLQKEMQEIERKLSANNKSIEDKKDEYEESVVKLTSVLSCDVGVDVRTISMHKMFCERIQDELLNETMRSKSLNREYAMQLSKMRTKYSQKSMLSTLIDNNSREILTSEQKKDEKISDDLALSYLNTRSKK